ncbi:uncharacterized protein LOC129566843 [Sitodiplosis mosellana]|uniref:uncharacterized protein LOC129566843 n=1 Tax=Sitodiplosis mosellana TaxID=263140 RepID=UPI002444B3C9|nr:uncharacterized protein LOC129566843 [Sitodiplosis mosellana]XP_055299084.1 uncharacterized protein LOC129566843 [Sitodiplosis mosellana]XP_055299085.1 uncharacterized protein LOC129566843 [Sitodiplosis mosellana]XP_055299086.1 uncharacterized protein LOC129566843 [Sitodiplosis mosellana]XP_055299087.1 uncharacterized protein LOC129566843 [Sitodiplosis mosellana]
MASKNLIYSVVIFLVISSQFTSAENEVEWQAKFDREFMIVMLGEPDEFVLLLKFLKTGPSNATLRLVSSNPDVVQVYKTIPLGEAGEVWKEFQVDIHPLGLGNANITVEITRKGKKDILDNHMAVSVTRNHMIKKFKAQNVLFYLKLMQYFYILMNICFGAALNVKKLTAILRNPIGPSLALISNFVILPLTSFILGLIYLPNVENQLFLFGIGLAAMSVTHASNHWTVVLGGNIDLSIMISFISLCLSFGLTTLYIYLIKVMYDIDHPENMLPYNLFKDNLYHFAIPLAVGMMIQNLYPRSSMFSMAILKRLSPLAILNIHFFYLQFDLDLYMYGLFKWVELLPGLILVLVVYGTGWLWTLALRLKNEDCAAIVLEALNKNICLAMFIVKTIQETNNTDADIFPTSVVIMTAVVLVAHMLWEKIGEKAEQRQRRLMEKELQLIKYEEFSSQYTIVEKI